MSFMSSQRSGTEKGNLALIPLEPGVRVMGERRVARKRGRARLRLSPLRPRPPTHTHPAPWELSARIGFQLSCGGQSSGEGNRRAAPARSLPLGGLGPGLGESPSQIGVVGAGVRPQEERRLGPEIIFLGSSLVQRSPLTQAIPTSLRSEPRSPHPISPGI